eukprot:92078_1
MTNEVQNDKLAPKPKRQKISYNNNTNDDRHNFQNVDFQQIKANGAPYNCPFCDKLSFHVWTDWKQHWYQLHNTKYFDDAKKNMKLNMNNHNNATYKPK